MGSRGSDRTKRRRSLAGIFAAALPLLVASTAWACTPILPPHHPHQLIASPESAVGTTAPVSLEAIGVPVPQEPSIPYPVRQDDDGTVAGGKNASTPTGCGLNPPEPVVGEITYDGSGHGTGSATLEAFDGPGVYEICAGPDSRYVKGYFLFM